MRLSNLTIRFRRNRATTQEATRIEALDRRQTMSLEAMSRAAQSRSIKGGMRARS